MKRNQARFLAIFAIPGIVVGLAQGTSQARSMLPSAGRAVAAADYGCFALDASTMTNVCSTTKMLEIPLIVDAAGVYTVTVTAQGATSANNVGCQAFGVSRDFLNVNSGTPRRFLTSFGVAVNLVTSASVPFGGGLFVNCQVSPGGRVNMVNW
jgi:hypothetical protein